MIGSWWIQTWCPRACSVSCSKRPLSIAELLLRLNVWNIQIFTKKSFLLNSNPQSAVTLSFPPWVLHQKFFCGFYTSEGACNLGGWGNKGFLHAHVTKSCSCSTTWWWLSRPTMHRDNVFCMCWPGLHLCRGRRWPIALYSAIKRCIFFEI